MDRNGRFGAPAGEAVSKHANERIRQYLGVALTIAAATLALLPSYAAARHSLLEHVSTGPNGGNGPQDALRCSSLAQEPDRAVSADGSRVFFCTNEALVPQDTDSQGDIYERINGATRLVTPGTPGGVFLQVLSDDGAHVFFSSSDQLAPEDNDSSSDMYERFDGQTRLITTGPTDPGDIQLETNCCDGLWITPDGEHAYFETRQAMVAQDTDTKTDIYVRSGGITSLVTVGTTLDVRVPFDVFPRLKFVSDDGTRVFFETTESLVAGDTDYCPGAFPRPCLDVYERSGGSTALVSVQGLALDLAFDAKFGGMSDDGSRVFYVTGEDVTAEGDGAAGDVFVREAGTTTLVSTGPADTHGPDTGTGFFGSSADGSRVFLNATGPLTGDDNDGCVSYYCRDIYERHAGNTTLISTGPARSGNPKPWWEASSEDGTHVFFQAEGILTTNDDDNCMDIYERSGGVTTLVSTGLFDPDVVGSCEWAQFGDISADGEYYFFESKQRLTPDDTDLCSGQPLCFDVYERHAGRTYLVSSTATGPNGPVFSRLLDGSANGRVVAFNTGDQLLSSDTDGAFDVYSKRLIDFDSPAAASPLSASLVPELRQTISSSQCQARGGTPSGHGPPLAFTSCNPPAYVPGTQGRIGPASEGSVALTVVEGDPTTATDEADVAISADLTDVRTSAGGDYDPIPGGPESTLVFRLRVTDRASGTSGADPGTTVDFEFPVPVDCSASLGPEGADCTATTSADAAQPGAIREAGQSVLQVFRLRVNDAGPNALRGDADDRRIASQGIFIP
jgi:hypothetical protein